jgi:thymidylate synthase (FAD)
MCEIKLHVRVPMDAWRQWIRHRTASVNEYSTRYSIAIDAAQRTPASAWRSQSPNNKQGSGEYLPEDVGLQLTTEEASFQDQARELYQRRLNVGVAREQARKDLPLSTYTEAYWKTDLHNLLQFLALRMDAHAQLEIRSYATVIGTEIVRRWVPNAWEAFEDYRLRSMTLSALEARVLAAHITGGPAASRDAARALGWLEPNDHGRGWRKNRERDEFLQKVAALLGVDIDWSVDATLR